MFIRSTHLTAPSRPSLAGGMSACLFKPSSLLLGKTKQHTYLSGHWVFFLNFRPAHWPGGIMGGAGFGVGLGSFENEAMGWVVRLGLLLVLIIWERLRVREHCHRWLWELCSGCASFSQQGKFTWGGTSHSPDRCCVLRPPCFLTWTPGRCAV